MAALEELLGEFFEALYEVVEDTEFGTERERLVVEVQVRQDYAQKIEELLAP